MKNKDEKKMKKKDDKDEEGEKKITAKVEKDGQLTMTPEFSENISKILKYQADVSKNIGQLTV